MIGFSRSYINLSLIFICTVLCGCSSVQYAVKEKFGIHKRDILRSAISDAKSDQTKASEQFQSALDRLMDLYQVDGGELEKKYAEFSSQYEKSLSRSSALKSRINKVNKVAQDLFKEWAVEIDEISNSSLRIKSAQKLEATQNKFDTLIGSFESSKQRMDSVLVLLKDQVLFLKHNLNASAVAGLENEVNEVQNEIIDLIKQIHISINEAEAFINTLPE